MRLINTTQMYLREWTANPPPYAVLSHRWGDQDEEVLYHDYINGQKKCTIGFQRIIRLCELARNANIEWAWVDTCCIDTSSSSELSEAINSMFAWYRDSQVCYVFLTDNDLLVFNETGSDCVKCLIPCMTVDHDRPYDSYVSTEYAASWFGRGWTIQELLAPRIVSFYHMSSSLDNNTTFLGTKDNLADRLVKATGIPKKYLLHEEDFHCASVAQRMAWGSRRSTSRPEDMAYCLLGLFDINIALLYGEGERAFQRLQEAVLDKSSDETLLAWTSNVEEDDRGLLVRSPAEFGRYPCLSPGECSLSIARPPIRVTGHGIEFHVVLPTRPEFFSLRIMAGFINLICAICRPIYRKGSWSEQPKDRWVALDVMLHCKCTCPKSNGSHFSIRLQAKEERRTQWSRTSPQKLKFGLYGFRQHRHRAPIYVLPWTRNRSEDAGDIDHFMTATLRTIQCLKCITGLVSWICIVVSCTLTIDGNTADLSFRPFQLPWLFFIIGYAISDFHYTYLTSTLLYAVIANPLGEKISILIVGGAIYVLSSCAFLVSR